MLFLFFDPNYFETILTVLKFMFPFTLLDEMFEQFWNLYNLMAMGTISEIPTFLSQMEIV